MNLDVVDKPVSDIIAKICKFTDDNIEQDIYFRIIEGLRGPIVWATAGDVKVKIRDEVIKRLNKRSLNV